MKKVKILVALIFCVAIIISIGATYSYYVDEAETKAQLQVANWLIKLNETDITLEETNIFTISDMKYKTYDVTVEGKKIKNSNNKFAPGMRAYFTIELDATSTMVALEYDVDIDLSYFENENIIVEDYEVSVGEIHKTGDWTYHGKMSYDNVKDNKKTLMKFTLKWLDNEDHQEEDNKLGSIPDNQIKMPVKVQVNQYTN